MNMILTKINNMNVEINKQYELILAIHAVYLLKHPELKDDEFDFIETPNIKYMHDLEELIPIQNYPEMIKYITNFTDCSVPINLAMIINDCYQIDYNKMQIKQINEWMRYGTIEGFTTELQRIANEIHWDEFLKKYISFYQNIVEKYCQFPTNLDLSDIERYYSVSPQTYTFIPSVLMNGGFGVSDYKKNLYYNYGIKYYDNIEDFYVNHEYLVECLFHEFSHPIVNSLVDKYLTNTNYLEKFYLKMVQNNLFKTYSKQPETVMYEYLVRANAYILTSKYFQENMPPIEDDWVIPYGFIYLPNLVYFTTENLPKYKNYAEFVQKAIPEFINECTKQVKKSK
mgnify:CR=1 FL=1